MGKLERGNTQIHYNKDCFFPIKNDSLSHLVTMEDMNSFERCDSPFQLAHNTSAKRIYFVQLLVSSHLQNSLKDCRRLTLEVACPRLPVRVLKRQNWAVSAPTVEKIGGAGGAKNAKHFKGYLTHMSQYIFQSIFLLIELKSLFVKCTKNGGHS